MRPGIRSHQYHLSKFPGISTNVSPHSIILRPESHTQPTSHYHLTQTLHNELYNAIHSIYFSTSWILRHDILPSPRPMIRSHQYHTSFFRFPLVSSHIQSFSDLRAHSTSIFSPSYSHNHTNTIREQWLTANP